MTKGTVELEKFYDRCYIIAEATKAVELKDISRKPDYVSRSRRKCEGDEEGVEDIDFDLDDAHVPGSARKERVPWRVTTTEGSIILPSRTLFIVSFESE